MAVAALGSVFTLLAASWTSGAQAESPRHVRLEAAAASVASGNDFVQDLPLAAGGFQRVLYLPSTTPARGVMVMFPGGSGEIDIEKDGTIKHANNFVVRTRDLWQARGYDVILVDALDHQSLRGQRSTAGYAQVTADILAFAREQHRGPVWVLGTSQGSIAAVNAAAHAASGEVAGVIVTESVSVLGGSHETVFDAHPNEIRAAALVVANTDDGCNVAPPSKAPEIARSMRATEASVLIVHGGVQKSKNACGSLTPHGYFGIEAPVVGKIIAWMEGVPAQR